MISSIISRLVICFVSMEAECVPGNRDVIRLPTLALGLSSVRVIVSKLEAAYTRVGNSKVSDSPDKDGCKTVANINKDYDSLLDCSRGRVWKRFAVNLGAAFGKCIPSVTLENFSVLTIVIGQFTPKMISYFLLYPFCRLIFGTLYPAYASYKAVRTKNLKEYVKWMMYWIVFALFTCTETITDVFLSWFPFYYEVKIVLVLWLLSPATKGSSILYRKFVHPALCRREQEIDEYIAKAKDQGYHTVLNLGTKGVNYATTVIMQTAIKGGGGLVQQLRKSYSLSDLTECDPREERSADETDDVLAEPRLIRRAIKSAYAARRSASESNSRQPMYFPEVDVDVRGARTSRSDDPDLSHVKSSEDISSGYSSAENSASLARAGSAGARRARPARTALTAIKRPQPAEESEVIVEELHDSDILEYANMPPLVNLPSPLLLSQTDPPFIYQCIGGEVRIVQVLNNFPLFTNNLFNNNCPDERDQEAAVKENEIKDLSYSTAINDGPKDTTNDILEENVINTLDQLKENNTERINDEAQNEKSINDANVNIVQDNISLNTINTYSEESDDEASFGTPDNSPKSKKKSPKGKYGKSKAPLPPVLSKVNDTMQSEANLVDIINTFPNLSFNESESINSLHAINPIAEKKNRHKSRSPGVISKASSSGIIKLLQLPSKLAFWHKNDDIKKDSASTSSGDRSRRSSTVEKIFDEFQSCADLNASLAESDRAMETFLDQKFNELHSRDINEDSTVLNGVMEKSDALQKLIDAKLESHPEYKFVSLHNDVIETPSKSTDV